MPLLYSKESEEQVMKKKMSMKVLATVLATMMIMSGCGTKEAAADAPIMVGTSFPLTGSVAADGKLIVDAIQLAADQVNAEGGINGRKIELVSEDDQATPASSASIANKFSEDESILGVLTSYNSSCGFAQVDVFKEAGLPAITPVCTNPGFTGLSDYWYRTCASDAYVGNLGADLCEKAGWKKVALLYENDDYGLGIAEEYKARAAELGIEITTVQTFVYGETVDFSTVLTAVADSGAEGMFVCGLVTETGLLCEQKASYGCADVGVAGADGLYSPALFEYGDAVEGVYTLGGFTAKNDTEVVKKFVEDYKAAYGEEPGNWAALAYDAAMTMFEAMKKVDGELTREKINEQLQTISYEGVTGTNKFIDGDVEKQYLYFIAKDGDWEIYE